MQTSDLFTEMVQSGLGGIIQVRGGLRVLTGTYQEIIAWDAWLSSRGWRTAGWFGYDPGDGYFAYQRFTSGDGPDVLLGIPNSIVYRAMIKGLGVTWDDADYIQSVFTERMTHEHGKRY